MTYSAIYDATDLGEMAIDVAAWFLKAITENAAALATLIVIGVIVVVIGDLIYGIFGIFKRI